MNEQNQTKEFRIFRGTHIREYVSHFSATEKFFFGVLVIIALLSSLVLANRVNNYFMSEVPSHGGELREGVIGLPRTINPVLAVNDVDKDLTALIYSGLMKYRDGSIVTDLAKSYEISKDGLIYTFILHEDLRFQDGTLLTTADVAFTIKKIQDPALKSPKRTDWANIAVEVISPTEIKFALRQAYSPFINNTTVGIIPSHIWSNVSDEQFFFSQYNIEPIGSGPYKISAIKRDKGGIPTLYSLETWNKYHDDKPFIKKISFHFFSDEDKALEAVDKGMIDSLASLAPVNAEQLASNLAQSYDIQSKTLPRIFGVFFNQNQSTVLMDKNVRHALDISVDREAIVDQVLRGYGSPIYSPLPTSMSKTVSEFDIEKAIAILEKAGWKKNTDGIFEKKTSSSIQTLSFDIYTADAPDLKQAGEMIRSTWSAMGANVNLKIFEANDLYQNIIRTRKYDALLFGEFVGKDKDLYAFWHSSQRNTPGLNISQYTNSSVDKILEDVRTTQDDDIKTTKYAQFEKIIREDIPAVFVYSPDFIYLTPKIVKGVNLESITIPSDRWNSIHNWYITTEKVWKFITNL